MILLSLALLVDLPLTQAAATAVSLVWSTIGFANLTEDEPQDAPATTPSPKYAVRIKVIIGQTHPLTFSEPIVAISMLDPAVATIAKMDSRSVLITSVSQGETTLIISGANQRVTYAIQVIRPVRTTRTPGPAAARNTGESYAGRYAIYFTPGLNSGRSILQQEFEFRQSLSGGRVLRARGQFYNFFGRGQNRIDQPFSPRFTLNRLELGLDSPRGKFDLIDSTINVSPLSFNYFTLRGPHFTLKSDSRWDGLEVFAGRARPQFSFFDQGEGLLAGVLMPILRREDLRLRSGAIFVAPRRSNFAGGSAVVWHADARYAPNPNLNVELDADLSRGRLSWRARVDLRRGPFSVHGELSRLDRGSPLVQLGAQSGGRNLERFGFQWKISRTLTAGLDLSRTTNFPTRDSQRIELNSRSLNAYVNYRPGSGAAFSFTFTQQKVEQPTSVALPFFLDLQTRTFKFRYQQRISGNWTNEFEARLIQSRELHTGEPVTNGVGIRERLRYTWRGGSLTGFLNVNNNSPSLAGLLLRNPQLLPAEVRPDFIADPAGFLQVNRDVLPLLLPNVALPITNNKEVGVTLQSTFSRVRLFSDLRYSTGKIYNYTDRRILASATADVKLDPSNSLQFSVARSFNLSGGPAQTTATFAFVHRFGSDSGGGFQFTNLLGLSRAHIEGRVYSDLNGNGEDDPDEPGVAGMNIIADGKETVQTNANGRYRFDSLEAGEHVINLVSETLGVTVRATNSTRRQVFLSARQTLTVSYGVNNSGFMQGRAFNDLLLTGGMNAQDQPGVGGVRIALRPSGGGAVRNATVAANGAYEFHGIAPGSYVLEIDPASLPDNFRRPAQFSWPVLITASQGSFLDLPFAAQRAVTGIVFVDKNGNGKFDLQTDEAVGNATVRLRSVEGVTDRQGAYLLRGLPAGKYEIAAYLPDGRKSHSVMVELGANPLFKSGVDLHF